MNINNVIAKAQRLMLDENFNRNVERAAAAARGGSKNGGSDNEFADFEAELFGVSGNQGGNIYQKNAIPENANYKPTQYGNVQILHEVAEPNAVNTKVPAAIRESFAKTPYQGTAFDITGEYNSVLDSAMKAQPQAQQPINEQRTPLPSTNYGTGAVNYDLIKYIVNEAVKEALKGNLNESAGNGGFAIKGMRLIEGNTFQFLDKKGNLFEAKLTLKKKA